VNLTEEQYELAERYLAGILTGDELSEFEKMMEENPLLKEQTEKIRSVNELLFLEGLKAELPAIQKAQEQYLFRQQLKQYGRWLGGSFIMLVAAFVLWSYWGIEEASIKPQISTVEPENTSTASTPSSIISVEPTQPVYSTSPTVGVVEKQENNLPPPEIHREDKIVISDKNILPPIVQQDSLKFSSVTSQRKTEDPCKEMITGTFEVNASCENKSEGSIRLISVSGGTKPYLLNLDQGNYRETTSFQLLPEGEYQITIRDAKGCLSKPITLVVPGKVCVATSRDFVFSYQHSQGFEFPDLNETNVTFRVVNRSGGLEYSTEVIGGVPSSWNGYSTTGQKLAIGSYSFQFVSSDHQLLLQGTITIVD
jgi:hypothetical protein